MTRQRQRASRRDGTDRQGVILIIVLVVVVVLSFAAYTFSELMLTHYEATLHTGDQLQAEMLVESGVDAVRHMLVDPTALQDGGGVFNNPTMFQNMVILPSEDPASIGAVTVISPNLDGQGNLGGVRYGLEDESARLNLNVLLWLDSLQEGIARDMLMGLPNMTEDIADAILDWMDEDEEPRDYGAEIEYYTRLDNPYEPTNGPLSTVEELLKVRGVTPQLLFGLDVNRNGVIDQEEQAGGVAGQMLGAQQLTGPQTDESGNEVGTMERGWSAYLTLYSQENSVNQAGEPRIDLNNDDLEVLYEELSAAFSSDWATFIVAYRQGGPANSEEPGEMGVAGELDFDREGGNKITQVLDLIGAKTSVRFKDAEEDVLLASPFLDDIGAMNIYLPKLLDNVTAVSAATIPGRININQAPSAILKGIPGMTEEMVEEILAARGGAQDGSNENFAFETWLMTEAIVDLEQMKALSPFVTAGGDVYRAQIVGYFQDGNVSSRAEVVIDASGETPTVVMWTNISHLGRGYPLEILGTNLAGLP